MCVYGEVEGILVRELQQLGDREVQVDPNEALLGHDMRSDLGGWESGGRREEGKKKEEVGQARPDICSPLDGMGWDNDVNGDRPETTMYKSQSGSNAALAPWKTRHDGPLTREYSYKGFGRMQGLAAEDARAQSGSRVGFVPLLPPHRLRSSSPV